MKFYIVLSVAKKFEKDSFKSRKEYVIDEVCV